MQLTCSTNKANMKTKELSKEVRHKGVEKHRSGEGYKKISKSLIIPLNTVKSIIKKWKTYHTNKTLPKSDRPSKLSSRASRKLVQDVTVNPTMTLKDLQGSVRDGGQCSSGNNIPSPSQSSPAWAGGNKEAITERKKRKKHI